MVISLPLVHQILAEHRSQFRMPEKSNRGSVIYLDDGHPESRDYDSNYQSLRGPRGRASGVIILLQQDPRLRVCTERIVPSTTPRISNSAQLPFACAPASD